MKALLLKVAVVVTTWIAVVLASASAALAQVDPYPSDDSGTVIPVVTKTVGGGIDWGYVFSGAAAAAVLIALVVATVLMVRSVSHRHAHAH